MDAGRSNKFRYVLEQMASPDKVMSFEGGSLVVSKNKNSQENLVSNTDNKLDAVVNILTDHSSELSKTDVPKLERIREKFQSEIEPENKELAKKITNTFSSFITLAKESTDKSQGPLAQGLNYQQVVLFQVKPAPKNLLELNENLALVLNNYPRYQLDNNLSVIDTIYDNLPSDWNPSIILSNLERMIASKEKNDLEISREKKELLLENVALVKEIFKPKIVVNLTIICTQEKKGDETKTMLFDVKEQLETGIGNPIVMSQTLFNSDPRYYEIVSNSDVYYQRDGGLIVIVPKDCDPKALGFVCQQSHESSMQHGLIKWNPQEGKIPENKSDFVENLKQILADDSPDLGFYRLIYMHGHGISKASQLGSKGYIADLEIPKFQKSLNVLADKKMVFLSLDTCYGGGINSTDVHALDGSIPCPIYIKSATDVVSYLSSTPVDLNSIRNALFPRYVNSNFVYLPPKALSVNSISRHFPEDKEFPFSNQGTILMQTPPTVPRIAYGIAEQDQVLDVSSRLKQASRLDRNVNVISDKNEQRRGYLFSEPVFLPKLIISGSQPKALVSRGGSTHHYIREIEAVDQEFDQFLIETFNVFIREGDKKKEEPANKAFFIGKMRCMYQGQLLDLENVVIANTVGNRSVIFKIANEDCYHKVEFELSKTPPIEWIPSKQTDLSNSETVKETYKVANNTQPHNEQLLQVTGGRENDVNFYEKMREGFWGDSPSLEVRFYHSLVSNQQIFTRPMGDLPIPTKELKQSSVIPDVFKELEECEDQEEKVKIIQTALILVQNSQDKNVKNKLAEYSNKGTKLPLFSAILQGNMVDLKLQLSKNPEAINYPNHQGYTPLHLAVELGNQKLIEFLIQNQADINYQDNNGNTPLHLAIQAGDLNTIQLLLKEGADINNHNPLKESPLELVFKSKNRALMKLFLQEVDFKGEVGSKALLLALEKKELKLANFLVKQMIKLNSPPKNYLEAAVKLGRQDIIEKFCDESLLLEDELYAHNLLKCAIDENQAEIVKIILNKGFEPNIIILNKALENGNFTIIKMLIENKKNLSFFEISVKKMVELLQEKESYKENEINELLQSVVKDKFYSIMKLIISHMANRGNPNAIMMDSIINQNMDLLMTTCLKDNPQTFDETFNGLLPLNVIIQNVNQPEKLLSFLLEMFNVDPNKQDANGDTPLHIAVATNQMPCITALLSTSLPITAHASLTITNNEGKTPLDIANESNNFLAKMYLQME